MVKKINGDFDLFKSLICWEIYWGLFSVAKMISHFGGKSLNSIISSNSNVVLKENTNMIAYYIFKNALFISDNISKLFQDSLMKKRMDLCTEIDNVFFSPEFEMFVDSFFRILPNVTNNSSRMSIICWDNLK